MHKQCTLKEKCATKTDVIKVTHVSGSAEEENRSYITSDLTLYLSKEQQHWILNNTLFEDPKAVEQNYGKSITNTKIAKENCKT